MKKENLPLLIFRLESAIVPSIVSFSILGIFIWLFLLSSEGGPRVGEHSSADNIIILTHLIPAIFLSVTLLVFSFKLPLNRLRFQFVCGMLALAITMFALHIYVWLPRLEGGWKSSVALERLVYGIPIYGILASLVGLLLGYAISFINRGSNKSI